MSLYYDTVPNMTVEIRNRRHWLGKPKIEELLPGDTVEQHYSMGMSSLEVVSPDRIRVTFREFTRCNISITPFIFEGKEINGSGNISHVFNNSGLSHVRETVIGRRVQMTWKPTPKTS